MPCGKYKSKRQRNLCFATDEWKDWKGVKKMDLKFKTKKTQTEAIKSKGVAHEHSSGSVNLLKKGGKIKNGI